MKKITALLFFLLFVCYSIKAQHTLVYKPGDKLLTAGGRFVTVLEDKANTLTMQSVLASSNFTANKSDIPNLSVSNSAFWLKFNLKNESGNGELMLDLAYPNLNEVELYFITNGRQTVQKMGNYKPFAERKYNSPGYIFDLPLPTDSTATVLIKIKSGGQIMAPIYVGSKDAVFERVKSETLFVGVYSGIIIIMFLYNLFIYFTTRDRVYIYYVIYILVVGLVQVCLLGYTYQFLWPNSTWLAQHSVYLLSPLSCLGIIEFIKVFLNTKQFTPKLHKGFHVFSAIYSAYIILDLFNLGDDLYNLIQVFAMLLSLYILVVAYRILRLQYRPAKFLFISWIIFLIGVFVYALKDVGVLPYNSYTVLTMPIGSAIETALLSFALADRINILKMEKENSQAQALELSRINERIIKEQNELLEKKVSERTRELEETNRNLEQTREQLVQTEKMASLGQLTAGISHEINNPINFVVSNVQPLKRDIRDVLTVLNKYGEVNKENVEACLAEINKLKKELDIDYVFTEIDLLLKGIDEGATRTSEIVRGLKNFSRVDEGEIQSCDIHEGIDSTLSILGNVIRSGHIQIIKNYGSVQPVECFPNKLNQVFMNVLNNAIHAINLKKYKNGEGRITISTKTVDDKIEIRISDNGIGISKAQQSKVFEPFFTTKPVGAGTGLGLSIVYGIINSHNGTIEINSEENDGAEFVIRLPLKHTRV